MPVRIYLDTSVYNRPFDDQTQPRVWLETLAFSIILQMIEDGSVMLMTSSVLEYEVSRNPNAIHRNWIARCMGLSKQHYLVDESIRQRASVLEQTGIKAFDALHVACAEAVSTDYFVTGDDRLIRRYSEYGTLQICNPVEFIRRVSGGES
jgi:predicted nucleic acid-binding protein